MRIREAAEHDFNAIWPIFHEIVSAGETYAYDPQTTEEDAFALWMTAPRKTFVAEEGGRILGTYFIKDNQAGPGRHVCNCGYMVAAAARGQGLATLMCAHSQDMARQMGYLAMQYNLVITTNEAAVRLWSKQGFDIVGRIPRAFNHPRHGLTDALVMYKWLAPL